MTNDLRPDRRPANPLRTGDLAFRLETVIRQRDRLARKVERVLDVVRNLSSHSDPAEATVPAGAILAAVWIADDNPTEEDIRRAVEVWVDLMAAEAKLADDADHRQREQVAALAALAAAADFVTNAKAALDAAALTARRKGASWGAIGHASGYTKTGAHSKWVRRVAGGWSWYAADFDYVVAV